MKFINIKIADRDSFNYYESNAIVRLDSIKYIRTDDQSGWSDEFEDLKTEIVFLDGTSVYTRYTLKELEKIIKR